MMRHTTRHWRRVVFVGVGVGALGIAGMLGIRNRVFWESSPWLGRRVRLARLPYRVVIGPVDATNGIPGLISAETTRTELLKALGEPLVSRLSLQEAARRGFIDPDDVGDDFFAGLFAWVNYTGPGPRDRVASVVFDLRTFTSAFGGDQAVIVRCRGQSYLLDSTLSRSEVEALLKARSQAYAVRADGSGQHIKLVDTGTELDFGSRGDRLERIEVIL